MMSCNFGIELKVNWMYFKHFINNEEGELCIVQFAMQSLNNVTKLYAE